MVMGGIGKIELKTGVMAELVFEGKVIGSLGVNDDRHRLIILEVKGTEVQIQLKK
jgi:hypothetical protein